MPPAGRGPQSYLEGKNGKFTSGWLPVKNVHFRHKLSPNPVDNLRIIRINSHLFSSCSWLGWFLGPNDFLTSFGLTSLKIGILRFRKNGFFRKRSEPLPEKLKFRKIFECFFFQNLLIRVNIMVIFKIKFWSRKRNVTQFFTKILFARLVHVKLKWVIWIVNRKRIN